MCVSLPGSLQIHGGSHDPWLGLYFHVLTENSGDVLPFAIGFHDQVYAIQVGFIGIRSGDANRMANAEAWLKPVKGAQDAETFTFGTILGIKIFEFTISCF